MLKNRKMVISIGWKMLKSAFVKRKLERRDEGDKMRSRGRKCAHAGHSEIIS